MVRRWDSTDVRADIDNGSGQVTKVEGDIEFNADDASGEIGLVDGRLDLTVDSGTVTAGEACLAYFSCGYRTRHHLHIPAVPPSSG